jgi:uncharacterized protein (TIGR02118 family)
MIKMTFCLRRAPHLSWDEFSDYWRDVHAPLVASHADVLGIQRYVQTRPLDQPDLQEGLRTRMGTPAGFDGVAELWLDSLDRLQRPSAAAKAASMELREDERRFIDVSSSPIFAGDEFFVLGPEI